MGFRLCLQLCKQLITKIFILLLIEYMNFTESNSLNQCLTLLTKVKDYNEISFTLLANRVQFGTPYCHFDDDLMMTENRRLFDFLK